jgi:hypothetical protein
LTSLPFLDKWQVTGEDKEKLQEGVAESASVESGSGRGAAMKIKSQGRAGSLTTSEGDVLRDDPLR